MNLTTNDLVAIASAVEKLHSAKVQAESIICNGYRIGLKFNDGRDGSFYYITSIEKSK